jgi:hypothetical protein
LRGEHTFDEGFYDLEFYEDNDGLGINRIAFRRSQRQRDDKILCEEADGSHELVCSRPEYLFLDQFPLAAIRQECQFVCAECLTSAPPSMVACSGGKTNASQPCSGWCTWLSLRLGLASYRNGRQACVIAGRAAHHALEGSAERTF